MNSEIKIRTARIEDAQALLDIYRYYVEETAITYEYKVPTPEEFRGRIAHILERYPYLVAESERKLIGYAYAGQFHPRKAYGWDIETTIYLDKNCRKQGIGSRLYSLLEEILKAQGIVNAIALITPPRTESEQATYGSMHFHEKMGYHLVGRIENSGYKFDQWFDTVYMEKELGTPSKNMQNIKSFDDVRVQFAL